ncbi:MAG: hypothetical protein H0X05_04165 [Actinobacteria bacterium]|nr:hypothetical protein [Actinomycetota bacterium]
MRRTIGTLLPLCFVVMAVVTPASAVVLDRDTGFDARDVKSDSPFDADIRSTTRKLSTRDGGRVLAIIVHFYEADGGWPLEVRLDANGGPRVDHVMRTFDEECFVWPKGRRDDGVQGRGSARGDRFVCRLPARRVSPTKSIRWKVRTSPPEDAPARGAFEIDYAPSDRGWYS